MIFLRRRTILGIAVSSIAKTHSQFIEQQLAQFEAQLNPNVEADEALVKRAIFYIRNQTIEIKSYNEATLGIQAVMTQPQTAFITLAPSQNTLYCSCDGANFCVHKLAVLLTFYQYLHSVQNWQSEWLSAKQVQQQTLTNERTPQAWAMRAEQALLYISEERQFESYNLYYAKNHITQDLRKTMPFEREWQPIYWLFMELYLTKRIWQMLDEQESRHFHLTRPAFLFLLKDTSEKLTNYAEKLHAMPRLFATDTFYIAILQLARDFLTLPEHLAERLTIYTTIIENLLPTERQLKDEADQQQLPAAQVVFAILLDEPCTINIDDVPTLFYLLQLANDKNARLNEALAKELLPLLADYIDTLPTHQRDEFTSGVYQAVQPLTLSVEEEMQLFASFGTSGIAPFSRYLIEQNRFDEWVALHLLHAKTYSQVEANGLKTVLKMQPQAALPLLHHFALLELDGKSRQHYKRAVRIWKTMKTAAKKANERQFFNDYMTTIQQQYKRLRALQEELEKGNLFL